MNWQTSVCSHHNTPSRACCYIVQFKLNKIMFKEHGVCPMPSLTLIGYFYPNMSGWPWPLGSREVITKRVSPAVFDTIGRKHIEITTLTFLGHVTSSFTWPSDAPYAISYCCPIRTEPLSSNRFRDICIQIYLGHDLHLSGSRNHLIPGVPFPIGVLL